MKRKSVLTKVLAATLTASMVLSGCAGKTAAPTATDQAGTDAATDASATGEVSSDEEMTFEIYDVAANYQGEQTGWYGKVLKDELNIKLNIIAPQVSGDPTSLYQTRCSSGNLGDIVILNNADMQECVDAGLVQPIDVSAYPNLAKLKEQIDLFNADLGDGTQTYAIPTEMNTNGPTAYMAETVLSYPAVPWNLYAEQGCPELKNLDDLLDLLKKIQDAHPTNEAGDKAYAISLWPDWDDTSIETVNQMTKWYGQEVNQSVLIGTDNTIMPLTDKNGAYYKMLKFLFKANQMGLVDPDSATQDWTTVCDNKMKQGRVYLFWYNWQRGFWNTPERGEERLNYAAVPVADTVIYQPSDYYYGSGRCWGIGSKVDETKKARIMEYLDWLASPAGATFQHAGTEGLIYTVNDDGTYTLTEDGLNRFNSDVQVPDDQGGGLWADGNNQVNQWILQDKDTNPETGECYDTNLWKSTIEANKTATINEWCEQFDAPTEVEYFKKSGLLTPVASVNKMLAIDDTDISLIRGQCAELTKDGSWKMIFAKDEAEFDSMWDSMVEQMNGLGWETLVKFDTEKYQPVIDARKAAK
ncbi:MAG: sugar ABC transporter substrate-binding protein [Clostridia bacterium]|nr:sugar ABC transporter substrate-binding protein [Clostridia bacterium]